MFDGRRCDIDTVSSSEGYTELQNHTQDKNPDGSKPRALSLRGRLSANTLDNATE